MFFLPRRPAWQQQATCRPHDQAEAKRLATLFVSGRPDTAKKLCQQCPVVVECLEQALADPGLRGVWGGMTDTERRRERRRRNPT